MGWVKTLGAAVLVVVGFTVQNVTVVYWTQANISNFGILILCGCSFALIFGAALLAFAAITGDWRSLAPSDEDDECRLFASPFLSNGKLQMTQLQILACVGFLNALNGFGIVYASPPSRTPPLVQAILQNSAVIWSVPFSKAILGDRKIYLGWAPARAALIIVASVAVSIAPTFASSSEHFDGSSIAWIGVYIAGLGFGAAYNVMQQLYFIRSGALVEGISMREAARHTLRALFYSNMFQPVAYALLVWLDFLPWFGTSVSGPSFAQNTGFSLACSVGGPVFSSAVGFSDADGWACPAASPIWAWVFIGGYAVSYVGAAQLNRESATFNMLCFVIVTMTTAAFWLIPGTNPNPSATPLWSVLTSLVLSLIGSAAWKQWESGTPATEQFDVAPSAKRRPGVTFDGDELEELGADPESYAFLEDSKLLKGAGK
jgi:hypothetical protein